MCIAGNVTGCGNTRNRNELKDSDKWARKTNVLLIN